MITSNQIFLLGYIESNLADKVISLYKEIRSPDEVIIIILFNACAQLRTTQALDLVKRVATEIPKSFYLNARLVTSLVDASMKCGDVQYAESLFKTSTQKVLPMYGAMMKGDHDYCRSHYVA